MRETELFRALNAAADTAGFAGLLLVRDARLGRQYVRRAAGCLGENLCEYRQKRAALRSVSGIEVVVGDSGRGRGQSWCLRAGNGERKRWTARLSNQLPTKVPVAHGWLLSQGFSEVDCCFGYEGGCRGKRRFRATDGLLICV